MELLGSKTFATSRVSVCLQGLIFVVDSNDPMRLKEAADELHMMVKKFPPQVQSVLKSNQRVSLILYVCVLQLLEDELRDVAVLVMANKQDLPRATPVRDITEAMGLSGVRQPVRVLTCGRLCHFLPTDMSNLVFFTPVCTLE